MEDLCSHTGTYTRWDVGLLPAEGERLGSRPQPGGAGSAVIDIRTKDYQASDDLARVHRFARDDRA
jgi:hypothetical protein